MKRITLSQQVVGNIGLWYVCYRLSGWVGTTCRRHGTRGVDIVAYDHDASATHTI